MAKYVLAKGEKVDKNTVRVEDYIKAEIRMVSEEKGYITNKYVGDHYDFLFHENSHSKKVGDIIIKNNLALKRSLPVPVEEFLTGTRFEKVTFLKSITGRRVIGRSSAKELDTFVYLFLDFYPTVEELWTYIQEHENVEEYKEQLEELKAQGSLRHLIAKKVQEEEQERAEQERLTIRRIG